MPFGSIDIGESAKERRITISYDIVTPESAEEGDVKESGWEDEEGTSMEPDKYDVEEGKTAVDLAVRFLVDHGAVDPSSYPGHGKGTWYSRTESDYKDGSETTYHYHLVDFSPKEEKEIYEQIAAARRR